MELCRKQANRLKTEGESERSKRRAFIQQFTSFYLGMGITESLSDASLQSNFQTSIIKDYGLAHPDKRGVVWDVVAHEYVAAASDLMQASQIFVYNHGQDAMSALFGPDAENELFSSRNSLLLHTNVEAMWNKGLFAIVPNINEQSEAAITLWEQSQEYKIRILDPDHPTINRYVYNRPWRSWKDLNNRKLEFKNDFRPRIRYLYIAYCVQILRAAWARGQKQALPVLSKQIGPAAWGTRGRYIAGNQLRATVDELGHVYEFLLKGADETKESERLDDLALVAVVDQIEGTRCEGDTNSEEEEQEQEEE